jgi:glycosyltransferase involved in cell wall biosynthesis
MHHQDTLLMAPALSVVTCTHNPRADYFAQVLESLKRQTLARDEWEYVIVDNKSDPAIEGAVNVAWHPQARIVIETSLGLTNARLKGIEEARGRVIVFVDDDNVLDPDYLHHVARLADEWPFIGAWGGQVRPEFERQPPEWTRRYWSRLVVREFEGNRWSNLPLLHDTMPSGAGLCVRREVAMRYLASHKEGRRPMMLDRLGKEGLLSGGDTDLAACASDIGLGLALFDKLRLTHLIPSARLSEDYLVRLIEGMACSSMILHYFRPTAEEPQEPTMLRRLANVVRSATMPARERRFRGAVMRGERQGRELVARLKSASVTNRPHG